MTVTITPATGLATISEALPDEEVLESAAARVRPIILQREKCYYGDVLNALGLLVENTEVRAGLRPLRERWDARVRPDKVDQSAIPTSMVLNEATGQSAAMDQVRLGLSWVYGDVVHHNLESYPGAELFGVDERFRCAAPLVAASILLTITLLDSILAMHRDGLLNLPDDTLTERVTVDPEKYTRTARIRTAPLGTALPQDASEPLGPEWQEWRGDRADGSELDTTGSTA